MTNIWEKDKRTIFAPILTLSAPILRHRESLKKALSKNSKKYNERISRTSQRYTWPQDLLKNIHDARLKIYELDLHVLFLKYANIVSKIYKHMYKITE